MPLVESEDRRVVSPRGAPRRGFSPRTACQGRGLYDMVRQTAAPRTGPCGRRSSPAPKRSVDLARVACALERYRLANGQFPETLEALAPKFIEKLPHDIINGQPLKYRRTDDGQFVLYSVGWNETDDGGKVGIDEAGNPDMDKGDWVWRYPTGETVWEGSVPASPDFAQATWARVDARPPP